MSEEKRRRKGGARRKEQAQMHDPTSISIRPVKKGKKNSVFYRITKNTPVLRRHVIAPNGRKMQEK